MTAVGSAGGSAMMMWVATHNAKAQEQANEAVGEARDMLEHEKKITEFRHKMSGSKPEDWAAAAKEIKDYLEANKDSPYAEELGAELEPMARQMLYEYAKHQIGEFASADVHDRSTPVTREQIKELAQNEDFKNAFPDIAAAIERGDEDWPEKFHDGASIHNSRFQNTVKGAVIGGALGGPVGAAVGGAIGFFGGSKDGPRADNFDDHAKEKMEKEMPRNERRVDDMAQMASKERELQMAAASEKRDAARQMNEQGAKLISSQNANSSSIINTVYRA